MSDKYWEVRGLMTYKYKNETFYTITAIPYYYSRREIVISMIKNTINNPKFEVILDFGCGDGWYTDYLYKTFPYKKYTGIDISHSMIKSAKKRNSNIRFLVSSNGINSKQIYDGVYSVSVFAHVMSDRMCLELFKNIYLSLKVGGIFILFEQTGPRKQDGLTYVKRESKEYVSLLKKANFILKEKVLVSYKAHNFFERKIAKLYRKLFVRGANYQEKCIKANQQFFYRLLSSFFVFLSGKPIKKNRTNDYGYTFYILKK